MLEIPKWLLSILSDIKCCVCEKRNMVPENIVALGIRKSSKNRSKVVFFFDYACKCGKNSIIEFPEQMNLEGFVNMMVDEYIAEVENNKNHCNDDLCDDCKNKEMDKETNKKHKNTENNKHISKISIKEVEELKKILNKSQDFPSFLSQIGVSQELINIKRIKKGK
jgi:hypothetical protein